MLSARVMADLEAAPTLQGYNSGLSAGGGDSDDEGVPVRLGPDAMTGDDHVEEIARIDEEMFNDGLGLAGASGLDWT